MSREATLLGTFLSLARNNLTTDNFVLECESENWTYGELDAISSALAIELYQKFGAEITVASITENQPYVLAILIATWKLSGIFAPLDPHSPLEMLTQMLEDVKPTCVIIPEGIYPARSLTDRMQIPVLPMDLASNTVTQLAQKYMHHVPHDADTLPPPPAARDVALYLHTSSAASAASLKCVPISHGILARGSYARLAWLRRAWPSTNFDKLRVLGWAPWTHIMGLSHDLGAAVLATGGCYVFGVPPPGYPGAAAGAEGNASPVARLLDGILRARPDALAGVPWMLQEIHAVHANLVREGSAASLREAERIQDALVRLKYLGVGGAQTAKETLRWAIGLGVWIVQDMGMTELGRPLFHSKVTEESVESEGWLLEDCLIDDAELALNDGQDVDTATEGELVITSTFINSGYLKYDNSAFSRTPEGRISFRTGDVYTRTAESKFVWRGRKEDYIQMVTSETLDPRSIEQALNACPSIADCCIVGNNFLRTPSEFVCAIIRPAYPQPITASATTYRTPIPPRQIADITRAIASVNRTLLPPLRVTWARVLLLDEEKQIPRTRKGTIFRKKLEDEFSAMLASHLAGKAESVSETAPLPVVEEAGAAESSDKIWKSETVERLIMASVSEILGTSLDVLRLNADLSFAELGMDSTMAVNIVIRLNTIFALRLPLNTCHTFVDLTKLHHAVLSELGIISARISAPSSPKSLDPPQKNTVVIVGQALRLPGDINTPESFWEALINKRDDIITDVPTERWDHRSFYRSPSSTAPPQPCDITFAKAGFVDVAHYDNTFFGISAPEALYISPMIRLTLETAFEALEDACIPISRVKGSNMGVFVGTGLDAGYSQLLYEEKGFEIFTRFYGTGMAPSTACGRLSYLLDVHGPSTTIDTACSSGLVAFDQGVKYLQSGSGESAIVSAVSTNVWPGAFGFLSAQKMTSPNSRCATFTDEADGYVPSEGCVTFILKTEAAALRDGDKILAVVKSSDVMHGGKSQGLVAPNIHTQIDLQSRLLDQANLRPADIDFLEAHGTGTSLGDLIEIQGINKVFQGSHPKTPLIISAAKSCIGHTELAAGLVGVLTTVASFQHNSVPGLMHLTEKNMNPSIDCSLVPIHIPHETVSLPHKDGHEPHRALVLANGFAGTIAGVVLEAPKRSPEKHEALVSSVSRPDMAMLFVVSAKSSEALQEYLQRYLHFCEAAIPSTFQDICYTSCVGREHYRHRFACVASNMQELIGALEERLRLAPVHGLDAPARHIVFAFPGQGSHYSGMAASLAGRFPEFAKILAIAATTAETLSGYAILSLLLEPKCSFDHSSGQTAQICIFVYQYSVATWLKQLEVIPSGILGHSIGEIAGAVIAGALTYHFGLELVIRRAEILRSDASHPGGMAIVAASKETITLLIRQQKLENELVIAVYNSPQSHVISGGLSAVELLVARAKSVGLRAAKLNVSQAFHSPLIWPSLPRLQEWVDENQASFCDLEISLYSAVRGHEIPPHSPLPSRYWMEHARNPVRFSDAAMALTSNSSVDVILDIGPQPFIWTSLQDVSHGKLAIATSTKPSKDQPRAFLQAIASLFERGLTPYIGKLFSGCNISKVSTPSYPFQRRRHFPNCTPSRHRASQKSSNPIPKTEMNGAKHFLVDAPLYDLLSDHRIEGRRVIPGAALVDFFALQSPHRALRSITFHAPMVVGSPNTGTSSEFDAKSGIFFLKTGEMDHSVSKPMICSGIAALDPFITSRRGVNVDIPCESKRDNADVYSSYTNVDFGPSFRNIQELRTWPTHADSYITVKSTLHPSHDRIRKLDCCLHGIGAIVQKQVPQVSDLEGSFLPTSLDGFVLHSDDIPESFICRYHLPFEVTRNFNVVSTSFEVLSHSGTLLISCEKYSLAWIPAGSAVQNKERFVDKSKLQWFYQSWIPRSIIDELPSASTFVKYDQILYVGYRGSRLAHSISTYAHQLHTIYLPTTFEGNFLSFSRESDATLAHFRSLQSCFNDINDQIKSAQLCVILDLTPTQTPSSRALASEHHEVLDLMKLLLSHKVIISNFTLISELAVSCTNNANQDNAHVNPPSTASLVQGMLRVFRRETGFDTKIWALDIPRLDEESINRILLRELHVRQKGLSFDRVVAYRTGDDCSLTRVVPVLRAMVEKGEVAKYHSGTTVIVGMGSIGCALALSLASRSDSKVVFIGRRSSGDIEVRASLSRLHTGGKGRCSYVQADVNNVDALRGAFLKIRTTYGAITTIIHTAVVVRDATIQKVETASFDEVLAPKVAGTWNLHLVSAELCPSLRSFVLLSSISVSLGNQGQIGYVAGNYYMEVLASYRKQQGLPATCIQLGAWESRLTETMDDAVQNSVHITRHEDGIPLILRAIGAPRTVQVVASLDMKVLAENPAYALDPFFHDILPKVQPGKEKRARVNAFDETAAILRTVLELETSERLETSDTMTACGIDSIAFSQIRGRIMHQLAVDVPTKFLSDSFTVREMMDHVAKEYAISLGEKQ